MAGPTTIFQTGNHASRPAASAGCVLYSCTDHGLVYRSDGSSWATWATLSAGGTPLTTRGDLLTRDASALARLAVGSANTVLKSDGTDPAWGSVTPAMLDVSADNTTANATSGHHGLLPKLSGSASDVLKGDGSWGAGGGGGITHAYAGYNTVGGSSEASVVNRQYMKSFTLAAAGVITSLGVYIKTNTDGASGLVGLILADSGGAPADILAITGSQTQNFMVQESSSAHTGPAQWVHLPVGLYVPSGTYWMGWMTMNTQIDFYYDGSGSDQYGTSTTTFVFDGRRYTLTNSTKKYSARVSVIS